MIGLYLVRVSDEFTFNHKIYGKDTKFIDRCSKTYQNTNGNLGILLSGVKGTGKSVTAKQICNAIGLPVIIVEDDPDELPTFIGAINQDVVILIDEYEKIFQKSHSLLSVMDGVAMSNFRRVFVLSTNDNYINENLMNRPGRIRYNKKYGNLEAEVVYEIADDLLKYPEYREDLITVLKSFTIVTIDLVISIINEINIHGTSPSDFVDVFNVEFTDKRYDQFDEQGNKLNSFVLFPYTRDIVRHPGKFIGAYIYVREFSNSEDIDVGIYKGYVDGFWVFADPENDAGEIKIKFKPALNPTFGYSV